MEDLRDHGPQPLDSMMEVWQLSNHQLVDLSTEQLSHKQVQRARKGRQMTLPMMQKVCRAFNIAIWTDLPKESKETYFEYMHRHLFNYAKGYDADWIDPNKSLFPEK
ncbi:MAG: hypothetical protein H7Y36_02130 [Armatimonadetes bacterium]|nr:hypothetical protein [Akkermansiaceae bacterium]